MKEVKMIGGAYDVDNKSKKQKGKIDQLINQSDHTNHEEISKGEKKIIEMLS